MNQVVKFTPYQFQGIAGGDKPHSRQAKKIRYHLWRVEVMRLE
jgi:hypothetical protein